MMEIVKYSEFYDEGDAIAAAAGNIVLFTMLSHLFNLRPGDGRQAGVT